MLYSEFVRIPKMLDYPCWCISWIHYLNPPSLFLCPFPLFVCYPVPGLPKNHPKRTKIFMEKLLLIGGFNPFEKYARQIMSTWIISPGRGGKFKKNKTTTQLRLRLPFQPIDASKGAILSSAPESRNLRRFGSLKAMDSMASPFY